MITITSSKLIYTTVSIDHLDHAVNFVVCTCPIEGHSEGGLIYLGTTKGGVAK